MASTELPDPAPELELARVLGPWYVLFTSRRSYYRERSHARVDYEALAPDPEGRARLQSSLRYRSPDLLGRSTARIAVGTAVAEDQLGQFKLRGHALARLHSGRFCFTLVDPDGRWTAVWHSRTRLGAAAGLDICTRDPSIPQARLDAILAAVQAHRSLADAGPLVAVTQHWIPPTPYQLG